MCMGIYTRVIEKCVLDMDHYCPWMNNCVGRRNYRYFILYLIYMVVGCVFVITFVVMESVALTANERFFTHTCSIVCIRKQCNAVCWLLGRLSLSVVDSK